ncbi:hypothetical protein RR46_10719 [Papilio xuthus]|uniref:Uncharacterized protein n=1 Tax=Papilio xuthus TaxID=66420 RepID=A0A194PL52_PAPXU|nr:hypothetical protein RR46_10719 [Papilio xuthus]
MNDPVRRYLVDSIKVKKSRAPLAAGGESVHRGAHCSRKTFYHVLRLCCARGGCALPVPRTSRLAPPPEIHELRHFSQPNAHDSARKIVR